ncbi:MAG: hypothetical protein WC526_00265 [Patescibacteria group bacterium]
MKKLFLIAISICLLAGIPLIANAQLGAATGNLQKAAGGTGLQSDLTTSVANVIKVALSLVGTVFLGLTIYAGVMWMTAAGEEKRIETAKTTLKTCIIGLVIVLSAYAITYFVTTKLGGSVSNSNPSGLAN